jgi:hypothetical protein
MAKKSAAHRSGRAGISTKKEDGGDNIEPIKGGDDAIRVIRII